MFCKSCFRDLPNESRFCAYCGSSVISRENQVHYDPMTLDSSQNSREFVMPDLFRAGEYKAERRITTIMFADISGFTSFSETADPEQLRDLINACFHKMVPIIQEHGGQVDKFIGDEIMALFGAVKANEDDARRAINAAIEMLSAIEDFSRANSVSWNMHIGINTGLVVTGMVGATSKKEFSVIGDTVNVAARLTGRAQSGEILVGEKTFMLTRNYFDYEPVRGVPLKGKSAPVNVYKLKGPRRAGSAGLSAYSLYSPLVGRDSEISFIKGLLEGLQEGRSFILWISGEAGVGKSRLMAEIRESFSNDSLRWLEGKAVPMGRSVSYWPFIQILKEYMRISNSSNEQQAFERVEEVMLNLFPDEHLEMTTYITELLSIRLQDRDEARLKQMSAENLRFHIYRTVHRLFRRLADKSPVVLVFEDVHWADQSTLKLIEHIASLLRESRIGIVLMERIEEKDKTLQTKYKLDESFNDLSHAIRLTPLPPDVSRRLCETMLGVEDFKLSPLIDTVIKRSEGNPFFLEELLKALIDMKILFFDSQIKEWKALGNTMQIPESLNAVVLSRLDRMEDGVREITKYASVVGRSFLYKILHEMINNRETLEQRLDILLQMEIIREKLNRLDREYIFKHSLFQKITYESILIQERKFLHKHIGHIIEILFQDRLDEFYGLLAYHYTQAEEWKKAHRFLQKAGEKAGSMASDTEALELYHQTLSAYHRAFGQQIDPFDAAVMNRKMGEALFRKGQHHLAEDYLIRALNYYGGEFPTTRFKYNLMLVKNIFKQFINRLSPMKKSASHDKISYQKIQEIFLIRHALGIMYFFSKRELFVLNTLCGMNELERAEHKTGMLLSFLASGIILTTIGFFRLAKIYFRVAGKVVSDRPKDRAHYFYLTGYYEDCRCNWTKAQELLEHAIQFYRETGEVKMWAATVCVIIELSVRLGSDLNEALDKAVLVHEMGVETGDSQLLAWGLSNIGLVMLHMGKAQEAAAKFQESTLLLASIPDYYILLCSYNHLINCYLELDELKKAEKIMENGRLIIDNHGLIGPFAAGFQLKKAEVLIKKFENEDNAVNRSRAYQACGMAVGRAGVFKAYLPEAYIHLSRLQYLDNRRKHAATLAKGIALAKSQGNRLALNQADKVKLRYADSAV